MTQAAAALPRTPRLIASFAALGAAWNLFGIYQWWGQFEASPAMLMGKGMTPEQATLYASLPWWMTLVFAIGVFGGLAGSLLLMAGRRAAVPVFAASLAGYLALYAGDIALGVFAVFGTPQVAILSTVVVIAIGLLAVAVGAKRHGSLR